MERRHRYRVIVALDNEIDVEYFAHKIAEEFNSSFGGCTILRGIGYWAPDGSQDLTIYSKPMIEPCRVIEVVTVKESTKRVKTLVKYAASKASKEVAVVNQWIHFEHEVIECDHFQI